MAATRCTFRPSEVRARAMSPRRRERESTGETWTMSPSCRLGCMLWPCARKATPWPRRRSSPHNCAKSRESRRTLASDVGMADSLDSAAVREKAESGTGNGTREFFKKTQGKADARGEIMGDEGAGEKFGSGLAGGDGDEFVLESLLEKKDGGERRAVCGRDAGVAVPGSAVHAEGGAIFAEDDAVVAEEANTRLSHPEAGGGALARAGVAEEEVAAAILIDEAKRVKFDAFTEG